MDFETSSINSEKRIVERAIRQLAPWFHNIKLPGGIQTAPDQPYGDFPSFKWLQVEHALPERLDGWRVLDIGCNAGFYSIELAKRGAQVDAVDVDPHYLKQAKWVFEQLGLSNQVRPRQATVYDLASEPGQYDLVWFTGVLYHLRYPLLALDIVARKTKRLLVFQTLEMPGNKRSRPLEDNLPMVDRYKLRMQGWPKMAFIERRLAGDWTNWWAPDSLCVEAMLRSSGVKIISRPAHEFYICSPDTDQPEWLREICSADYNSLFKPTEQSD